DGSEWNMRATLSFLPGGHNIKTGMTMFRGWNRATANRTPQMLAYTFNNQRPVPISQFAKTYTDEEMNATGVYAQDQWVLRRLTLSYGLRLDTLHSWAPATNQPESRFMPARSFPEVDCVPCWKDLSPRLAAAYDVFGNGRTALKANFSRYVVGHTTAFAALAEPVNAAVNSV